MEAKLDGYPEIGHFLCRVDITNVGGQAEYLNSMTCSWLIP